MRIGVNLLPLRPRVMGGAEMYLRDLITEIIATGRHELLLVAGDVPVDPALPDGPGCRQVRLASRERRLAAAMGPVRGVLARAGRLVGRGENAALANVIRRERVDLWFCPFSDLRPRAPGAPSVITVHDLQHEFYPEFFSATELRHRRRYLPASCAAADHVIAVSEFTRRNAIDRLGVDPGRVTTIWEAPGRDVDWTSGSARAPEVRRRYGLPERYAFYPANAWPHKNHGRLLEALALCRARGLRDLGLVLTGEAAVAPGRLEALVASLGLRDVVHMLGYVPRHDLPGLYGGAVCLVHPSLFEGFGIPLIEAMHVGCPILAADGTGLSEVAGDAALLFDPRDPEVIARALATMAGDAQCAAELARRAQARASLFSAAAMARRTLDLFERVRRAAVVGR
jgi:glycosyltransferase involved in cell wall biosynthesis